MARINPDSFYVNGTVLPASYWQALDTAQSQTLNGDVGTSHTPSSPITVGGAGVWICGPSTLTGNGSHGIITASGSGARIVHGDSDWIQLPSGGLNASRGPAEACSRGLSCSFVTPGAQSGQAGQTHGPIQFHAATLGGQNNGSVVHTAIDQSYAGGGRLVVPIRVHHGATLTSLTVWMMVTQSRVLLPANLPRIRGYIVTQNGIATPLNVLSTGAGWVGSGWLAMTPASAAAYFNTGLAQSITYPCDPGLVIDVTSACYYLEVSDEQGQCAPPSTKLWALDAVIAVGALVAPTPENGFYYTCTVAGTTGTSQPAFPTTIGATVVDGSVTWQCTASYPGGAVGGNRWLTVLSNLTNIPDLEPG